MKIKVTTSKLSSNIWKLVSHGQDDIFYTGEGKKVVYKFLGCLLDHL